MFPDCCWSESEPDVELLPDLDDEVPDLALVPVLLDFALVDEAEVLPVVEDADLPLLAVVPVEPEEPDPDFEPVELLDPELLIPVLPVPDIAFDDPEVLPDMLPEF